MSKQDALFLCSRTPNMAEPWAEAVLAGGDPANCEAWLRPMSRFADDDFMNEWCGRLGAALSAYRAGEGGGR